MLVCSRLLTCSNYAGMMYTFPTPPPPTCTVTSFPPISANIIGSPTVQSVLSTTVSLLSISTVNTDSRVAMPYLLYVCTHCVCSIHVAL